MAQDFTGLRVGRLTVKSLDLTKKHRSWLCVCDCGVTKSVYACSLKAKTTVSCGCFQREWVSAKFKKHGKSKTPIYRLWHNVMQRCYNPKNPDYENYGARGVKVSEDWQNFENFYSDMGEKPEGLSLEREDNEKNYSKENCKWGSTKEQALNKRTTIKVTLDGITKPLMTFCEELGVGYITARNRYRRGLPAVEILARGSLVDYRNNLKKKVL
jgi:hypothetical protein